MKNCLETDLKLQISNNELEKKNTQLNQANRIKSKFLSLISHDIRGTVGTLSEFLKLIISKLDTYNIEDLKALLSTLKDSSNNTYTTLDNLLSWSKNDMLQMEANKNRINIVEVINRIINYYKQSIELKKQKIYSEFYSYNILVNVDETMMETSLRNILSNAIKYTKQEGEIFIRVQSRGDKNIIVIEDTGIGMSKKTLSNLFSYDEKHRNSGTNGETSAGIGLLLVKEFLDKNGATVNIESEIGKGTKFEIEV
jgi:signal transduction histidine kinase